MASVRPAAVAGMFYPGNASDLDATIRGFLAQARADADAEPVPKAIIVPHAGYVYSGAVAASAYARLKPARDLITRVVLLGPCHRVAVRGLALSGADAFLTPLGRVPLDTDAMDGILGLPQVQVSDATHADEHSLEVHLPFLQVVLGEFKLVPLVVGDARPEEVAEVIERLWGGPETLIVVSSDLSHYLDYETARRVDAATCQAIEDLEPARIGHEQACGRAPVRGLLTFARRRGLEVRTVDLRNSGDTAGSRDRVVGYGSWIFLEPGAGNAADNEAHDEDYDFAPETRVLLERHGITLLHLAAASIEHGFAHGKALPIRAAEYAEDLRRPGASFVTLKRQGALRGCVGSAEAYRPLIQDVVENGYSAAFRDTRFANLTREEVAGLSLSVSVLSPSAPIRFGDEADLLDQLRPGVDGLVIEDRGKRSLFLPAVWESVPDPAAFLAHLKVKAQLGADHWSDTFRARRFVSEEISSHLLPDPDAIWRWA